MVAACATFHDCNSRKQFEARAVPKQGTRCARAEGHDRDLAGELQGAQESSVNLSPPSHLLQWVPAYLTHEVTQKRFRTLMSASPRGRPPPNAFAAFHWPRPPPARAF